ncbi:MULTISPECIES: hypothetical protein [unclassified Streptomyces]|uniref:hypothetical protein n=1 Tax=unclassified Streptomyces TaxID=2593676 RepID=UPI001BE5B405|nr:MULTISPECIES: hypothetical protein [unclassified Streptomyces]MBT2406872.1 hypothetical protein [Streptomyces sp. ISL-21]MBT2613093.1 hypothetical protein [Streptomyces sp. ISL-87]
MRITIERFLFGGGRYSKYAKSIAPDAEQLVREKFGSLPSAIHVILNGDTSQMDHLVNTAEAQLLPGINPTHVNAVSRSDRHSRSAFGQTTIGRDGVLIVLQIPNMRSERDVAETFVHELVHAHQLGDRTARGLHLDYLNHVWGRKPMKPNTVSAYELLIDQRETEAYGAESLASQL